MLPHPTTEAVPRRRGSLWSSLAAMGRAFVTPVPNDRKQALQRAAAEVPPEFVSARQYLGRQYAGCGATIGAMPRCDFACRGCYLGSQANRIPPARVEEVRAQLDRIREWLGDGGNVQITDGEVTLREERELIAIISYAREIGLVPMVMTHGDAFRRDPGLLPRLVLEGGLTEVCIHIDTTQRGRSGARFASAVCEEELNPLREEFAAMIRRVRKETRRALKVASTVTVTSENLAGVPDIVRCIARNADAFSLLSFLPIAQVGRTEAGLGGSVSVDDLWRGVAEGLYGDPSQSTSLLHHEGFFGHPGCNRFVQGLLVTDGGREPVFLPLLRKGHAQDEALAEELTDRFPGVQFRGDTRLEALGRFLGVVRSAPGLVLWRGSRFALRQLRRIARGSVTSYLWRWLRRRSRVDYLNIVSHHFMSAAELRTQEGRERLDLCVFKVPVGNELVSMCEFNSLGARDLYYAEMERKSVEEAV